MQISRKTIWSLSVVAAGAAAAAFAAWWVLAPATVLTAHPVIGPAVDAVYATGTVEATVMMPVAPRMGARLVTLNVDEGVRVKRGQILAQLEDEDMANQIRQLQAQEEFARSDYRRDSMLLKGGAIARATYDRALSDWKAAHAATEQAKATAGFMKLVAPADGQVISRDGEIGQLIAANQPLFWISINSPPRITAEVDEEDIARVHPGEDVLIDAPAFPGKVFHGAVESVTPKGDSIARSYRVRISLPKDSPLMIGMTAETNIVVHRNLHAFLVPAGAVAEGAVWLVVDGKLMRRAVVTGASGTKWTEIISGLSMRDVVVTAPNDSLKVGQTVRTRLVTVQP